ncbi:MAG: sigma-70 family RNA polymerase sigma factor [Bacteroidales bacterium]|nr:sigma-70 family RNA polymerase sigma factor [Bacteroidales bacterium]
MFGICINYVHSKVITEDLLQNAFITIIEKLPAFKNKSKNELRTAAILKIFCINYLRKKSLFTDIIIDDFALPLGIFTTLRAVETKSKSCRY